MEESEKHIYRKSYLLFFRYNLFYAVYSASYKQYYENTVCIVVIL
jgi:hypothetical protein